MKMLWCWRCQQNMPMLDEDEFAAVVNLPRKTFAQVRQEHPELSTRTGEFFEKVFEPQLDQYERLTGFRESNMNAVWHHRLSIYGPPCGSCGKPLRTPKAKFCAACGYRRADTQI